MGEVGPFLVVAGHLPPLERFGRLQPVTELVGEWLPLVLRGAQEAGELVGLEEIEGSGRGEHADEIGAHGRLEDALLEVGLTLGEVGRVRRIHPGETGENVSRDDDRVERVGVNVRIAVDVDVALGAIERRRYLEQRDAGIGRHVAGSAFRDLAVVGAVRERRHPALQVQPGGDEQVGVAEDGDEAGLRPHEVRVFVALGDRGHGAVIADDLPRDGAVGRQSGDHFHRGGPAVRCGRGQHREHQ